MTVPLRPEVERSILVIEDNPADARLVMETLKEANSDFYVIHAPRLSEAQALLDVAPVACILLDIGLPDTVGTMGVRHLRDAYPTIPIVVLSGQSDSNIAIEAVQQGAQDYLMKGTVDPDRLLRVVHYSIERKRAENSRIDLVASLTHELRTPLTSILGYAEMLRCGDLGGLEEGQEKAVDAISRSVGRLKDLTDNLLTVWSWEAGMLPVAHLPVDIVDVVGVVKGMMLPIARTQNVELTVTVPNEHCPVSGDRGQLERAILNLVSNAVKFTPVGGHVNVTVEIADDEVLVRVQDSGIGIPLDEQPRLFSQFFRSTNARKAEIPGTGLGLSIVRAIVDAHGGYARVESRPEKGSMFSICLPLQKSS